MFSFIVIIFLGTISTLLYWYLSRNFNYWKKRGVVNGKTSVIFGNLTDTFLGKKTLGEIYTSIYKQFPDKKVVGWFKFQSPGILIRDPELFRKILVTDFHSFRNNDVSLDETIDPIVGKNIFLLKDELWKKGRALITPAFTSGKIKVMYPHIMKVAKELVTYLKDHPEEHHVKQVLTRYTSEVVAQCAYGIEGNNFKESKPIMPELGKMIFEPTLLKNLRMMSFFIMPNVAKFLHLKMVPDKVSEFFDGLLRDIIVHRQENNIEKNDLVQYLIEVKRKTMGVANGSIQSDIVTRTYSDEDVLSGCVTFFLESFETTSLVLNNLLYFLTLHQDVQEKLRAEVDETLSEGELTFERLHGMSYLNSVYLETHRLLPVLYHMQKVCTENYEMDIGEAKPLLIEKGTSVVLPIYAVQTDPQYWDEPDLFKPERFTNKEEAQAKAKGIYLPFGDGPRMCPGSRIATTIIKLGTVQILANLQVLPTSRTPKKIEPDPNYFMIGHKGGIYLRFAERSR